MCVCVCVNVCVCESVCVCVRMCCYILSCNIDEHSCRSIKKKNIYISVIFGEQVKPASSWCFLDNAKGPLHISDSILYDIFTYHIRIMNVADHLIDFFDIKDGRAWHTL